VGYIEAYNTNIFTSTIEEMLGAIDLYQSLNPEANLINMAKTKGLTDVMLQKLSQKFDLIVT
jgi:hypothetical protein